MRAVRWALAGPGAIAAWYATFLVGIITHGTVENALCPAGEMESGMCLNSRVRTYLEILIYMFVALSAIAVVSAAVDIAPSHKRIVAWVVFAAGSLAAALLATTADAYGQGISAVAAAFVATLVIDKYLRHLAATRPPRSIHAS